MYVLIIEDEKPAAKRLASLLQQYDATIAVLAQLDTVKRSIEWLTEHEAPDLIFMDIQLADGLSFAIFDQVTITTPVIFTTAYDQYAIQAFKVNSVDYLLKPISPEELAQAVDKFNNLHQPESLQTPKAPATAAMTQIQQALSALTQQYKARFVVKVGEHISAIPTTEVLYFVSKEKATYMQTQAGRRFIIDYSLDQVEDLIDPQQFFRISRQYIVRFEAITDIITYSSSRLKLVLQHTDDNSVLVSRERVADFRQWLDR